MSMPVKTRENALRLASGQPEVNGKHTPARLHNPPHFDGALLAYLARQMMQHDCGEYSVELGVTKRQCLRHRVSEHNLNTGLSRFLRRSRKHFRRRVNTADHAGRPDLPLGCDGKSSCSATDIEDRLAGLKVSQAENLRTKPLLATER